MRFLIQDILDFAQINSGKFRKNIECFDIRDAVGEVMNFQKSTALAKGINFYASYINVGENIGS